MSLRKAGIAPKKRPQVSVETCRRERQQGERPGRFYAVCSDTKQIGRELASGRGMIRNRLSNDEVQNEQNRQQIRHRTVVLMSARKEFDDRIGHEAKCQALRD